jgi:ankyrin repeat protein
VKPEGLLLAGVIVLFPLKAGALDLADIAQSATPADITQALRTGADPNAVDFVGRTVLMLAATSNPDPAVITALAKAGAKVNARGPQGWTPLMMAAYGNPNPAVVLALLAAGADPRLRSNAGRTAFDYAQDNDSLKGTEALAALKTGRR